MVNTYSRKGKNWREKKPESKRTRHEVAPSNVYELPHRSRKSRALHITNSSMGKYEWMNVNGNVYGRVRDINDTASNMTWLYPFDFLLDDFLGCFFPGTLCVCVLVPFFASVTLLPLHNYRSPFQATFYYSNEPNVIKYINNQNNNNKYIQKKRQHHNTAYAWFQICHCHFGKLH